MRAVEQAAIATGEVSGLDLMKRAGNGVVQAIFAQWPEFAERPGRAVVLCGPGNNGGDGYVVARALHGRGWSVEVFAMGDPARLPRDARHNHDRWRRVGTVKPLTSSALGKGAKPNLLIDALFGTGVTRAIPEAAVDAMHAIRMRDGRDTLYTVAIDAPSGLDLDTGRHILPERPANAGDLDAAGAAALARWWDHAAKWITRAALTVTFHTAKPGHYLADGPGACARLDVQDIGLGRWDTRQPNPIRPPSPDRIRLVGRPAGEAEGGARLWPGRTLPVQGSRSHKYDRGHVLVLAGASGRGGAARLAARAALRVGAGLVTVGCPPDAVAENAARLDAIMLRPVRDADALAELLADRRLSSVLLGPGLGVGERTRGLVAAACARPDEAGAPPRKVVLDADALSSFVLSPADLFAMLHPMCVLTPHEGEFARLFPDLSERSRYEDRLSKVDAAQQAADRAGCTVLLKGPDTVIASPGGAASIHAASYDRTAPWLGTAGAGDVLAGLIAGLLAPAHVTESPHCAAETAAWLHVEAARRFGPGLIAEDLPDALPAVFRDLAL